MAKRPFFSPVSVEEFSEGARPLYIERFVDFKYFTGFALGQKRKSIDSFHKAIHEIYPQAKILEISTKSSEELGRALSAFNLQWRSRIGNFCVESLYQGSKVFKNGGPYKEIRNMSAKEAKADERLRNSGEVVGFFFQEKNWPINPPFMFYDHLYIKSLTTNPELHAPLMEFDAFTDIEFNDKKSINCQARAVAIFVTLKRLGLVSEYLKNLDKFQTIYDNQILI